MYDNFLNMAAKYFLLTIIGAVVISLAFTAVSFGISNTNNWEKCHELYGEDSTYEAIGDEYFNCCKDGPIVLENNMYKNTRDCKGFKRVVWFR